MCIYSVFHLVSPNGKRCMSIRRLQDFRSVLQRSRQIRYAYKIRGTFVSVFSCMRALMSGSACPERLSGASVSVWCVVCVFVCHACVEEEDGKGARALCVVMDRLCVRICEHEHV